MIDRPKPITNKDAQAVLKHKKRGIPFEKHEECLLTEVRPPDMNYLYSSRYGHYQALVKKDKIGKLFAPFKVNLAIEILEGTASICSSLRLIEDNDDYVTNCSTYVLSKGNCKYIEGEILSIRATCDRTKVAISAFINI